MDIPRQTPKNRRRGIIIGAAVGGVALVTLALARLPQAAPTVEKGTVWSDTVRRGTMVRQVRAPGTLVPEQIQLVSALTAGRVEKIAVRPGATVEAGTELLELSNPDVQLEALEAERQLAAAEAQTASLRTSLTTGKLQQESQLATVQAEAANLARTAAVIKALDEKGLSSTNEAAQARDQAAAAQTRLKAAQEQLHIASSSIREQLTMQERQVERMRAIAQFQRQRVQSMKVTAGAPGVLQDLPLELGQWVTPGVVLAKVAQPGRLKAVLRVPETQAKDVVIGQPVAVDTRGGEAAAGVIQGHVMRIYPASQGGAVTVEVALDGALPKGARPDLSVDGTIEVERLPDVLYVGRPAYGQPDSPVGLFKLEPDGETAHRVTVKLGRASVNTIEIVSGLNPGDRVIISDMSQWENVDRVKLK
ncbi:MAG TPA: HlyD family efflux transporter periplasmic adaptor subunit [Gemmatimonadaceae bacterium]|nr:HlyD family efflux transporter periplasmic adaptor subunit [Gemmatimonadaceae bacterium]